MDSVWVGVIRTLLQAVCARWNNSNSDLAMDVRDDFSAVVSAIPKGPGLVQMNAF
jgi:hypothetical protein